MDAASRLLDPEIRDFIEKNADSDVAALALKKPAKNWPWPLVLDQIRARQKAKIKLPSWLKRENIVFPKPDLMEQASSEAAARHKASLIEGEKFVDLTAGAGVDFCAFLEKFRHGVGIEKNEETASLLSHNIKILSRKSFEVRSGDAAALIESLTPCDFIYVDPQRRGGGKKGKFLLENCAPDILRMLPMLRSKAKTIMIKTSPVLDIDAAIKALDPVSEVHVVEWRGECRETLYILRNRDAPAAQHVPITATAINDCGEIIHSLRLTRAQEKMAECVFGPPEQYLYEPSPALMKAGAFKFIAAHYGVNKLHTHTHLYTSARPRLEFPGRIFEIHGVYPARSRKFPFEKAHVALRNFPGAAEDLRRRLGLGDGGEDYLFGCALEGGEKVIIHVKKTARQPQKENKII